MKELLGGVPPRDIERLAPGLLAGVLPRIYPQMLDEVRSHQDADRPTFIVSAAGNDLVVVLARVLGMEGGIGTQYEVDGSGRLTGRIVEPFVYGEGKVAEMRDFAAEHDIDLGASWAYSDSVSDLPMLREVGHPVAVNPDAELAEIAVAEGWRVMRFERLGTAAGDCRRDPGGRGGRRHGHGPCPPTSRAPRLPALAAPLAGRPRQPTSATS